MTDSNLDLLRGTLDLLILQALRTGEAHGLGLSRRIERGTQGAFKVKPGSLFPALHRLQEKGWLESRWGESENRRRAKFYRLTSQGLAQLEKEKRHWERVTAAMTRMLEAT